MADKKIERNIAMELVRVTEAAAMAAARHLGRGDKNLVDQSAVNAMRRTLGFVHMDGIVVIEDYVYYDRVSANVVHPTALGVS